jgi:CelD/BcsL family acetyltransferase involved in cellulose biosynthesis
MLQTGFTIEEDNNKRPGYMSHCLAMVLNAKQGLHHYDFMCGDADYKRALGNAEAPLVWLRLQKPRCKFAVEKLVVRAFRALQQFAKRISPGTQVGFIGWSFYELAVVNDVVWDFLLATT